MQLPNIKWVFFDVGYTLINEDDAVRDRILRVQAALSDCGVSVSAEDVNTALKEAVAGYAPLELFFEAASPTEVAERLRSEVYVTSVEVAVG